MSPTQVERDSWIAETTKGIIHPVALVVTPLILLVLLLRLVVVGFSHGVDAGFRSLAGALVPLLLLTFVYIVARQIYALVTALPTLFNFFFSLVWGAALLAILDVFGSYVTAPFPIREIILSFSLGSLVFGYVGSAKQKPLAIHYGMLAGMLIYIMFLGLPADLLPK